MRRVAVAFCACLRIDHALRGFASAQARLADGLAGGAYLHCRRHARPRTRRRLAPRRGENRTPKSGGGMECTSCDLRHGRAREKEARSRPAWTASPRRSGWKSQCVSARQIYPRAPRPLCRDPSLCRRGPGADGKVQGTGTCRVAARPGNQASRRLRAPASPSFRLSTAAARKSAARRPPIAANGPFAGPAISGNVSL